jgi:hypothetical protein
VSSQSDPPLHSGPMNTRPRCGGVIQRAEAQGRLAASRHQARGRRCPSVNRPFQHGIHILGKPVGIEPRYQIALQAAFTTRSWGILRHAS